MAELGARAFVPTSVRECSSSDPFKVRSTFSLAARVSRGRRHLWVVVPLGRKFLQHHSASTALRVHKTLSESYQQAKDDRALPPGLEPRPWSSRIDPKGTFLPRKLSPDHISDHSMVVEERILFSEKVLGAEHREVASSFSLGPKSTQERSRGKEWGAHFCTIGWPGVAHAFATTLPCGPLQNKIAREQ